MVLRRLRQLARRPKMRKRPHSFGSSARSHAFLAPLLRDLSRFRGWLPSTALSAIALMVGMFFLSFFYCMQKEGSEKDKNEQKAKKDTDKAAADGDDASTDEETNGHAAAEMAEEEGASETPKKKKRRKSIEGDVENAANAEGVRGIGET